METTEFFQQTCGIRQASILSPLFFVSFFNELVARLKNTGVGLDLGRDERLSCLMIMDDAVLLASSEDDMRILLLVAERFAEQWRVSFHVVSEAGQEPKTAVMVFPPRVRRSPTLLCLSPNGRSQWLANTVTRVSTFQQI
eukprot:Lithocolla_globosa_v1_NODE_278_length_4688_cov_20.187567.p4 type:complete len:140 gc:universal NODE_278_length_4688_cov_20.187567:805-386(-)